MARKRQDPDDYCPSPPAYTAGVLGGGYYVKGTNGDGDLAHIALNYIKVLDGGDWSEKNEEALHAYARKHKLTDDAAMTQAKTLAHETVAQRRAGR